MKTIVDRPSLVFLGSGNLATRLASAFFEKGYVIAQIYSQTESSASVLASNVNASYTTDIAKLTQDADIYICALKDNALEQVLSQTRLNNKLIIHTSGSVPMDVLAAYSSDYGVLYPLQTLSKNKALDFSAVPFFIEASDISALSAIKSLAESLSNVVYEADSEQRKRLHLAAVFACNFTNHMYAIAAQILEKTDFSFDVLLPLIDETAEKVHFLTPNEAQTGPAVRWDENVINKQLELLESDKETRQLYELISKHIHQY